MVFATQHEKVHLPSAEPAAACDPVGGNVKRRLDIVVAATALVLLLPLLLLVSLLVWATMGRPVLCRHTCVGFGGRLFGCYRFRTTAKSADQPLPPQTEPAAAEDWQGAPTLSNDPRITPLGRMLRGSGIDQLPQLINILKGEMSCVGPRPLVPDEVQHYAGGVGPYLKARPGMTGVCQERRHDTLGVDDKVALDSAYVHNWSMQGDIIILLKAIPAVARIEDRA
jgi:exopolysaccharide production protein ExoY